MALKREDAPKLSTSRLYEYIIANMLLRVSKRTIPPIYIVMPDESSRNQTNQPFNLGKLNIRMSLAMLDLWYDNVQPNIHELSE